MSSFPCIKTVAAFDPGALCLFLAPSPTVWPEMSTVQIARVFGSLTHVVGLFL